MIWRCGGHGPEGIVMYGGQIVETGNVLKYSKIRGTHIQRAFKIRSEY